MNKIKLVSLELKNFKGIKRLNISFGDNTNISSDNGKGKTTIFDSFTWLLFDKDSQDRKDFEIKTLDSNNEVIHGLDHEVTGVLNVNGKNVTLTKTFREKWTKKRGEADKQFTGHETLYYVDEVPLKKSEYQQKINSIIDENLFKLISNPLYFNTNMKWQERRNVILDIVGDITEDRVINYKSELRALAPLLEDKNIDDLKKSISSRKKKLNDDIKSIPYRIDELNNSIQEHDWDELNQLLWTYENDLKEVEESLIDSGKTTKDALEKQAELYALKTKLQGLEYKLNSNKDKPLMDLKSKLSSVEQKISTLRIRFDNLIEKKNLYTNNVLEVAKHNDELRSKWHEVNKRILEFDESKFICPTCNRVFEEQDIEAKKVEMTENFNQNKARELSNIGKKGKEGKCAIEKIQEDIKAIDKDIELANINIEELTAEQKNIGNEIANFVPVDVLSSNKEYQDLKKEIDYMEALIAEESTEVKDNMLSSTLKDRKKEIVSKIDEIKRQLMAKDNNLTVKTRMKELEEQERTLAEQIAKIEGQEFLCEEFIKTKVELLEAGINNKFKYVSFKMFDVQINGGLNETCEALINGVPFSNANTASQINAGIDIINVLSEYYKVEAPIFIDNRESINKIIYTEAQVVNLIVSQDQELKIESEVI